MPSLGSPWSGGDVLGVPCHSTTLVLQQASKRGVSLLHAPHVGENPTDMASWGMRQQLMKNVFHSLFSVTLLFKQTL